MPRLSRPPCIQGVTKDLTIGNACANYLSFPYVYLLNVVSPQSPPPPPPHPSMVGAEEKNALDGILKWVKLLQSISNEDKGATLQLGMPWSIL